MTNKRTSRITQIRNAFHLVLGFTFAYKVVNATGIFEMIGFQKYIMGIVAGFFVSLIIGVAIEYFQNVALKQNFDEKDVLRTIIGGLIGGIVGTNLKDVDFIETYMFIGCLVLIVAEVIRIIVNKTKKK